MAQETSTLVRGNNQFAFDLYQRLAKQDGNLFFSPYSISSCLGMVYAGARGETAAEIKGGLRYAATPAALPKSFSSLTKALTPPNEPPSLQPGLELEIANGLWAQKDHPFLAEYLRNIKENFDSEINQADFVTQAEPTGVKINGWVSDKTHEKIQNLISPGMINPSTRMVLVNAIYFKGGWKKPFQKELTHPVDFHLGKGKSVSVSLMNEEERVPYLETEQLQMISLPYAWGTASMVILLPKDPTQFNQIERELDSRKLESWIAQMSPEQVNIYLPKFKSTGRFQLKEALESLGMTRAFISGEADFSGMDGMRDLFISAVIHKAYIDVYEEGTEAAAATAVMMECMGMPVMPKKTFVFRADHPFIYLIRDNRTGSILFLGRMLNPGL
jgi:serpin B